MNTIKCVIVDDEPIACEIIENFMKNINYLELVAVCEDPFQVLKIIENNQVDLLISDIEMPEVNGLELGVVDYLLKPVRFDRFLKAVDKARLQIEKRKLEMPGQKNKSSDCIFIKVSDKESKKDNLIKIKYTDIL